MTSQFTDAIDPLTPPVTLARAVYAIGNFDGVHRGHQAVIARAIALARKLDVGAAALSFEPHPADFFARRSVVFRLTPRAAKAQALRALGLDGVVTLTFNEALAGLSAEEFVAEVLVKRLDAGAVIVGWDFHFGKARAGTPEFLRAAGRRFGFGVEILDKVSIAAGAAISSTAVREALAAGDVKAAGGLLGRDYSVLGAVIAGQRLGRTLDTPTANIALEPGHKLAFGIYAARVTVDGKSYGGVASFGVRPTVDHGAPLLEAHLFDFSGDLYGKTIEVAFVARLRGEEKFANLEALKEQMQADKARARAIIFEAKA